VNGRTGGPVNERGGIFLRQAAGPLFEAPLSELRRIGVGIAQGAAKFRAAAAVEFATNGFGDELASVVFKPVNVADEIAGECDCDSLYAGHIIL